VLARPPAASGCAITLRRPCLWPDREKYYIRKCLGNLESPDGERVLNSNGQTFIRLAQVQSFTDIMVNNIQWHVVQIMQGIDWTSSKHTDNRIQYPEIRTLKHSAGCRNDIQVCTCNLYHFTVTLLMNKRAQEWKLKAFEQVIWSSFCDLHFTDVQWGHRERHGRYICIQFQSTRWQASRE
jgi:hypothetical protein